MTKTTLYSNNCPKCVVLKRKLDEKGLSYDVVSDVQELIDKGFTTMPILFYNGKLMDFSEAIKYLKEMEA